MGKKLFVIITFVCNIWQLIQMKRLSKTDYELVDLIISDNENAFRELYLRYKDKLWYYSFTFLKSEEEAEDLTQEVFIRLWEFRGYLDPGLSISSFLYTVARNKILNYFRDMDVEQQVKKSLLHKAHVDDTEADSGIIYKDYQHILSRAVDKLPAQRKKVFDMSRVQHMSHKEIAVTLGISVNTVQEHISASLRSIKTYFQQHTDLTFALICIFSSLA